MYFQDTTLIEGFINIILLCRYYAREPTKVLPLYFKQNDRIQSMLYRSREVFCLPLKRIRPSKRFLGKRDEFDNSVRKSQHHKKIKHVVKSSCHNDCLCEIT
jgi:hypothetical protein